MVIRKLAGGRRWRLYSRHKDLSTGRAKVLGRFRSRQAAIQRERQIQFFKHRGAS